MIISCDSEPGATTCIKRMYPQAVLGRFRNALYMMEAKYFLLMLGKWFPQSGMSAWRSPVIFQLLLRTI